MVEYNVGDYILTRDYNLYRITNKYSGDVGVYYDIKSLKPTIVSYYYEKAQTVNYTQEYTTHQSVSLSRLRHFGLKIAEKDANLAKILYG